MSRRHGKRLDDEPDLRAQTSFWGYSLKRQSRGGEHAIQTTTFMANNEVTNQSVVQQEVI
jgi:hypothetical protein